jgi:4-amino-4-deoxy-L-arabinose transferase-like glycosyltransferase
MNLHTFMARRHLLILFLLALAPRLLYLASIPEVAIVENVDAQGYDLLARNLLAGHGFSLQAAPPYLPDGLRTPLYPLLIAAMYALFGPHPVAVAVVQAILDGVTALLVAVTGARVLGRRAGLVAGVGYALTPLQWRYAGALLAEIHVAFLVVLAFYLLARALERTPAPWQPLPTRVALACGAVAGLVGLDKANLAALGPLLALILLWAWRRRPRTALRVAGALGLAAVAVMAPWVARNWRLYGRPFLSNADLGFLARVSAPATLGVVEGHQVPPWSPEWEARYHALASAAATQNGWELATPPADAVEADRRERQIAATAWDVVRAHPWEALHAHTVGWLRSWAPQEQSFWYAHLTGRPWEATGVAANALRDAVEILWDGRPGEAVEVAFVAPWDHLDGVGRALWYAWGAGHLLILTLIALGAWRLRRRPALVVALLATLLYATLPPGPIGYARFRVPVVPLMLLLQTAGVQWIWQRRPIRDRLWRDDRPSIA